MVKTNIVNDRGIHICKSMLAWQKWFDGATPESAGKKGDHLIGDCYVAFDKHFKAEVKEILANDPEVNAIVKEDELVKLFVEPAFQSQGIGGCLLNYAVNELNVSWLWALEYNTRGIEFYKRNGFRFSGEKMLEDGWIPVLKLTKQSSKD